jgi:hypothetical protein
MNKLIELVKAYPSIFTVSGKKSALLVEKAEKALDVKLPLSYKQFLIEFGKLAFGARTYLGVIDDDFENSGLPDGIWYNLRLRREYNFPKHLIVVYNNNGLELICLDTKNFFSADECAIAIWDCVHDEVSATANVQFADYLLDEINDQLEELIEDEELENN